MALIFSRTASSLSSSSKAAAPSEAASPIPTAPAPKPVAMFSKNPDSEGSRSLTDAIGGISTSRAVPPCIARIASAISRAATTSPAASALLSAVNSCSILAIKGTFYYCEYLSRAACCAAVSVTPPTLSPPALVGAPSLASCASIWPVCAIRSLSW